MFGFSGQARTVPTLGPRLDGEPRSRVLLSNREVLSCDRGASHGGTRGA